MDGVTRHDQKLTGRSVTTKRAAVAGVTCLVLFSVFGGGLIVWWAVAFHRDNHQLWMVPIGLVLLGTPVVVWLSVFASNSCRRSDLLLTAGNGDANHGSSDPETGGAGHT